MVKRWSELSSGQRTVIVAGATVDLALKVAMLVDLRHRPASGVRGPKWLWAGSALVNSVGLIPAGYFVFGRARRSGLPGSGTGSEAPKGTTVRSGVN